MRLLALTSRSRLGSRYLPNHFWGRGSSACTCVYPGLLRHLLYVRRRVRSNMLLLLWAESASGTK